MKPDAAHIKQIKMAIHNTSIQTKFIRKEEWSSLQCRFLIDPNFEFITPAIEYITLTNQHVNGIYVGAGNIGIRKLYSSNSVPGHPSI